MESSSRHPVSLRGLSMADWAPLVVSRTRPNAAPFLEALADKVGFDAVRDAFRGYPRLAQAGLLAGEGLDGASTALADGPRAAIRKGDADLAQEAGDLRYDALTDLVEKIALELENFARRRDALWEGNPLSSRERSAAARLRQAATHLREAWRLSARPMGLELDGKPLGSKIQKILEELPQKPSKKHEAR